MFATVFRKVETSFSNLQAKIRTSPLKSQNYIGLLAVGLHQFTRDAT